MDESNEVERLKARVEVLEDVLLQLLTRWDFENASDYQMGRSDWEILMEQIKRAKGDL